jgi:palmitoyl transferase
MPIPIPLPVPVNGGQKSATAFITSRTDTLHSFPFPGVLPLVGLSYGKFTINSTYIPGGKGNGNVLFTFAHYNF